MYFCEVTCKHTFIAEREAHLNAIKCEYPGDNPSPAIRVLCPTLWTVRASAMKAVFENYQYLVRLWNECATSDPESKVKIEGMKRIFTNFDFVFGLHLGKLIDCSITFVWNNNINHFQEFLYLDMWTT